MTNRAQITRQAARDGVPAPTVERDYVLAHIMAALGTLDDGHGLVFKGGTALRLCYFEDYRYSADLDFSVVEGSIDAAYATIETALGAVAGAVDALHLTDHEPKRIAYRGPLGRQRYLKLDITSSEPSRGSYAPLDCCRLLAGENSCPTFCPRRASTPQAEWVNRTQWSNTKFLV